MYARPEVNGTPATLGVSGMLWRDALVMYDRATRSLWSQVDGKAVAGSMKGERLQKVRSVETTWDRWKRRHPDTLVLVKPPLSGSHYQRYFADPEMIGVRGSKNPDRRLRPKELVIGLEHDGRFAAVPFSAFRKRAHLVTEAFGRPVVITESAAWHRRVADRTLTFAALDAAATRLRDRETGSTWSAETGEALEGPLKGQRLTPIATQTIYWAIWAKFHPETEVVKR